MSVSNARIGPLCASIMSAMCCGSSVMLVFSSSVKVYPIGKCSEV